MGDEDVLVDPEYSVDDEAFFADQAERDRLHESGFDGEGE